MWDSIKRVGGIAWEFARTTEATNVTMALATIVIAVFTGFTWWEIHTGSFDTKKLADATAQQMGATASIAIESQIQANWTQSLADRMKEQADQTRTIAEQAKVSANAAKNSADAAIAGTRPWMKITNVELRPSVREVRTLMFHFPLPNGRILETSPMLQIKATGVNVGHSVARETEMYAEMFYGRFARVGWHELVIREEDRFCHSVLTRRPSGAAGIVFASEPTDWNMGVGGIVHEADITEDTDHRRVISGALLVCLNYRGVELTHYQTQARFGLYANNTVFVPFGVDADAGVLMLVREPNGDHAN